MAAYSPEFVTRLEQEFDASKNELRMRLLPVVAAGEQLSDPRAKEHIVEGAGRRLQTLCRSYENVFDLFPPSRSDPLSSDDLQDVAINLQAFVMNLYGLFENLAWAFVLRHDLEAEVGGRMRIGLFSRNTQKRLPSVLRDYVTSKRMVDYHAQYLKNYRDALAHRIPLYIPPATFTPAEGSRYQELRRIQIDCLRAGQLDASHAATAEMARLGTVAPMFLHSTSAEGPPQPVMLHPQMISDVKSLLELCDMFFDHWSEHD